MDRYYNEHPLMADDFAWQLSPRDASEDTEEIDTGPKDHTKIRMLHTMVAGVSWLGLGTRIFGSLYVSGRWGP